MVDLRMWKRAAPTLARGSSLVWSSAIDLCAVWGRWHEGSVTRKIFAASALLMALTVVCKSVAAVREVVTAYWFGTGDALDAFVVALTLPTFAAIAFGNSAGSALLPTLTQIRERDGQPAANRLLRESTFWAVVLLLGACVLLAIGSTWLLDLISPGFDREKQALARTLMLIVTPTVLLCGVTSLWNSTLNSEERFAASGLVPALTPLFAILAMFTLGGVWGIRSLAIGILVGALVELFFIGWILHRGGHRLMPIAGRPSKEVRQVLHQYLPLVVAAALMSSTTLVDNAMASELGSGSVATLSYGRKLVALAISFPVLSISRAIFPYFSRQVATRNWPELRQTLARSRWAVLLAMIPLAVILFIFSRPLTSVVLQRGAFRAESTEAVAWVQAMYAIQIPFYTLSILYVRIDFFHAVELSADRDDGDQHHTERGVELRADARDGSGGDRAFDVAGIRRVLRVSGVCDSSCATQPAI